MSSNNARFLVEGLLQHCGIDGSDLQDDNKILLSIDEETALFVVIDGSLINLVGVLGPMPDAPEFARKLLAANFDSCLGADYRYAIEPGSGDLLLSLTLESLGLEVGEFIAVFEQFVRRSEAWNRQLQLENPEIPTEFQADEGKAETQLADQRLLQGMTRV